MTLERRSLLWLVALAGTLFIACAEPPSAPLRVGEPEVSPSLADRTIARSLNEYLEQARRIPNASGWFEILELPNEVYAFWEPGHVEEVNAFLILGRDRDVLYDTGMGIANIATALEDVRRAEGLPKHELMLINSHNHPDHNGGNAPFDTAWIIEDEWAIRKLTEGIPAGRFSEYWSELKPHAGVTPPEDFDPETFSIPPFPRQNTRFLADGDIVDLGNRKFRVIHTTSHSPDGLALYDAENKILFGGDTFYGDLFLIRDLLRLEQDLERASRLEVEWHYSSHGPQLVEAMRSGYQLSIIRRMIDGERNEAEATFAGETLPEYGLGGITVLVAGESLVY